MTPEMHFGKPFAGKQLTFVLGQYQNFLKWTWKKSFQGQQQQSSNYENGKEKRLGMGDTWKSGEGDQLHNQVKDKDKIKDKVKYKDMGMGDSWQYGEGDQLYNQIKVMNSIDIM